MHSLWSDDPAAAKRQLRQQIGQLRGRMTEAGRLPVQRSLDALLGQLLDALRPRSVFCYLSTAREVDTHSLIDGLVAAGITVLVPRLMDRTIMIATAFPGWSGLVPGALGILSPSSTTAFHSSIDAVLVPGLAFSTRGARLGYGAGYYDRWLAGHSETARIGLCFEFQIVRDLPVASHDEPLDYLVTDQRLHVCPLRST